MIPTAQQVYSKDNVAQAFTNPVQKPNLADPMGLYEQYTNSPDIQAAKNEYQGAYKQLMGGKATARKQQTAIEGLPRAMNVIRGEQAQAQRLSTSDLNALADMANVAQSKYQALRQTGIDRYNIANKMRGQLTNLIANNPNAGITYADTVDEAARKVGTYEEGQRKRLQEQKQKQLEEQRRYAEGQLKQRQTYAEQRQKEQRGYTEQQQKEQRKRTEKSQKDAEKQQLKDAYFELTGKRAKPMSRGALRKKLSKLTRGNKDYARKMKELDYKIKLKAYNKPYYKPTTGTTKDLTAEGTKGLNSFFGRVKGQDGYVSPSDWARAKNQWAQNNLSSSKFNAIFGKWKNPNDKYN